jgi:hypothetical protein
MRWLVTAVVVMGVLILGATGVLVATLVTRFHVPEHPAASVAPARPAAITLDEPAGTRIASVSALGDRLVLALHGGGPDRVVVIDPASRRALFRVGLAR